MRDSFFRATLLLALLFCSLVGTDKPAVAQGAKAATGTGEDASNKKDGVLKRRVLGEDHSVVVFKKVGKQSSSFRLEIGKVVMFTEDEVPRINKDIEALAVKGMDGGVAEFFPNGVKTDSSEKRVWVTERYLPRNYNIIVRKDGELILSNGEDNTSASLGSIDLFADEELPNVSRGTIVDRKIGQEILDRVDEYFGAHGIEVDLQPGGPRTDKARQETQKNATN